ncbi:MAG: glycosyltransferase, partial [Bacteroidetes bacterium]
MHKVLFVATSDIHIRVFHIPYLKWLKETGCEVHLAVEKRSGQEVPYVDRMFHLPFPRTLFSFANFTTLRHLGEIIRDNDYDLVHCHTPVPSMLARIAARRSRKKGTRVLYTAHGFHFFKGGPLKNWLVYFPAEYLMSAFTDGIVTINREDYDISRRRMLAGNAFRIKGIGVDPQKFRPLDENGRDRAREALGYDRGSFILLYVAEFIYRKNHRFIIEALPELVRRIPTLKVLFAGTGVRLEDTIAEAKRLKVDGYVDFLGFRDDVPTLAAIADVGISSSRQEGLGLGLAEEMLCG